MQQATLFIDLFMVSQVQKTSRFLCLLSGMASWLPPQLVCGAPGILVFLPGWDDIDRLTRRLRDHEAVEWSGESGTLGFLTPPLVSSIHVLVVTKTYTNPFFFEPPFKYVFAMNSRARRRADFCPGTSFLGKPTTQMHQNWGPLRKGLMELPLVSISKLQKSFPKGMQSHEKRGSRNAVCAMVRERLKDIAWLAAKRSVVSLLDEKDPDTPDPFCCLWAYCKGLCFEIGVWATVNTMWQQEPFASLVWVDPFKAIF